MKYKTFRAVAIGGGIVLGAGALLGGCWACGAWLTSQPTTTADPPPVRPEPPGGYTEVTPGSPPPPSDPSTPATPTGPVDPLALRAMDRAIIALIRQGIATDKVKDAIRGYAWKVNVYRDAGEPGINRAKIDLDRDDRWDEKWTIVRENGRIEIRRQVAPADDDQYTEEYRMDLDGSSWVRQ